MAEAKVTLAALEIELNEAIADMTRCVSEANAARREETRAVNRLRAAQKAIDDRVASLREQASAGDWAQRPVGEPST